MIEMNRWREGRVVKWEERLNVPRTKICYRCGEEISHDKLFAKRFKKTTASGETQEKWRFFHLNCMNKNERDQLWEYKYELGK